jgi:aspartate carbamoyltransferase catalytic subunit
LGAKIDDLGVATSSVNKGESLVDTVRNLNKMGIDVMVIRHQQSGATHLASENTDASVINAGDGTNEHPTQALLDLMTIREKKGGFNGLKVAILGDINHSRVARSNVFGLTKLGARVVLAGASTLVSGGMASLGAEVTTDLEYAVKDADIVMALRIQLERQKAGAFPNLREYSRFFGVGPEILRHAKPDVLVMHPGPVNRGVELSADVIDGARSVIYEQVENGVAVRMALLKLLAG